MKKNKGKFKQNNIIFAGAAVVVLVIIIFAFLGGKQTYSNEENSEVTLNCPTKIGEGEIFECEVDLNTEDILSVNATYVLPDNVEYVAFVEAQEYEIEEDYTSEASSTKFAIGYSESLVVGPVGFLQLKAADTIEGTNPITIGLTEIELTYLDTDESTVLLREIDDINESISLKSKVNTLEGITLSDGELKETFNSSVTNYTATVNNTTETIEISVTKTDENSNVSGIGEISLHYGTNSMEIKVTSEAGTTKTYNLSIYRPYVLSTDYYIYDQDDNEEYFLYTKNDTTEEQIRNNLITSDSSGVTYHVTDNKLSVKYLDETLLSNIEIANFQSDMLNIIDNKIYLGGSYSYNEFIENISKNNVIVKVLNGDDEITSGEIQNGYTISIYYSKGEFTKFLESYEVSLQYLIWDDDLDRNNEEKIILRLKEGTTYSQLKEKIHTNGTVVFKSKKDQDVSESDAIATGSKVIITLNGEAITYTLSVLGDIDGDGAVDLTDVGRLYRSMKGIIDIPIYQLLAGNIIEDDEIDLTDIGRLYRYYKGIINSLEVRK